MKVAKFFTFLWDNLTQSHCSSSSNRIKAFACRPCRPQIRSNWISKRFFFNFFFYWLSIFVIQMYCHFLQHYQVPWLVDIPLWSIRTKYFIHQYTSESLLIDLLSICPAQEAVTHSRISYSSTTHQNNKVLHYCLCTGALNALPGTSDTWNSRCTIHGTANKTDGTMTDRHKATYWQLISLIVLGFLTQAE